MTSWIPVSERLPEFEQVVLILDTRGRVHLGGRITDSDSWIWGTTRYCFRGDWIGWCGDLESEDLKPTHWQPLPEPPESAT